MLLTSKNPSQLLTFYIIIDIHSIHTLIILGDTTHLWGAGCGTEMLTHPGACSVAAKNYGGDFSPSLALRSSGCLPEHLWL